MESDLPVFWDTTPIPLLCAFRNTVSHSRLVTVISKCLLSEFKFGIMADAAPGGWSMQHTTWRIFAVHNKVWYQAEYCNKT